MIARRLMILVVALTPLVGGRVAAQPPFPHQYHVEEEGIECADCHEGVEESRAASDHLLPEPDMCLDCHEEGDVRLDYPVAERSIYFDHARHTQELELECTTCHTGLFDEAVRSTGYLPVMDDCMACHNGGAAPRDCESCHVEDRAVLQPDTHTADWAELHGPEASFADASCVPCHAVTDCEDCHAGGQLSELADLGAARQSPFAPLLDGSAVNAINAVHGLNFRYLHGIEARGKSSDCLTCHEIDTGDFCAECHNPAGDEGLRPIWHGGADWGALAGAIGSGGGRHAEMARRDMENCAVCHDARGDDPTCLQCHIDRTPGLGNDPSTHSRDFADEIGEGDFHDDDTAVCYTCHVAAAQAGDQFCGYCHGSK
ncbi:MAG: cytochrome c3 family protein [Gemmatimonadetes bacterium]|nr:cytochrome c3 family protein [Gemmatimonadota bacterium]MBT7858943.1 cytochrome c3 family protein [Gemmatimonadota bacterium]